jgi:hypothetical protein
MTGRRHELRFLEAELTKIVAQHRRHLADAAVLGADRRLPHPAPQLLEVRRLVAIDVGIDVGVRAGVAWDARDVESLASRDLDTR